jgi:hypothetical protein
LAVRLKISLGEALVILCELTNERKTVSWCSCRSSRLLIAWLNGRRLKNIEGALECKDSCKGSVNLNKCGQLSIRHRIRDNAQGFLKAIEEECQRLWTPRKRGANVDATRVLTTSQIRTRAKRGLAEKHGLL